VAQRNFNGIAHNRFYYKGQTK